MVAFLECSGAATLEIGLWSGFNVEIEHPVDQDMALTRLTKLIVPVEVLSRVFNQHIFLPNLHTLRVEQDIGCSVAEMLDYWITFLSVHERRTTITTLGLVESPVSDSPDEVSKMFSDFINQVPNVNHLVLEGKAVIPSLQGLTNSKKIPSGIVTLEVLENEEVTEDLVSAFLKAFYAKKRDPLSLKISDCASITTDVIERLDLLHDTLKKMKEKKKRKSGV
ncbi:hypothetical protein CPB86DRAFT_819033 [Serendipita vermifera]|nr:hypothetical protein CPB86DRAFT_819033 [Serendipita vermifera]